MGFVIRIDGLRVMNREIASWIVDGMMNYILYYISLLSKLKHLKYIIFKIKGSIVVVTVMSKSNTVIVHFLHILSYNSTRVSSTIIAADAIKQSHNIILLYIIQYGFHGFNQGTLFKWYYISVIRIQFLIQQTRTENL
jgi:hypothetical protein